MKGRRKRPVAISQFLYEDIGQVAVARLDRSYALYYNIARCLNIMFILNYDPNTIHNIYVYLYDMTVWTETLIIRENPL